MKKPKTPSNTVLNRRARFDYKLDDELSVGMSLSGIEVRMIRDHHVQLQGSFVTIKSGQLWLNNLTLGSETARNIRLLATKPQIRAFMKQKDLGFTIIPTKILTNTRYIKLIIALGKGKKSYDKRETIKHRDLTREAKKFN